MLLVRNIFLVKSIRIDPFFSVSDAEELDEVVMELAGELFDELAGVFADNLHLTDVRFALDMTEDLSVGILLR